MSDSLLPQKMQEGECFFKMIASPSVKISTGSLSCISSVARSSLGMTILPRESMDLTIPVDFIARVLLYADFRQYFIILNGICQLIMVKNSKKWKIMLIVLLLKVKCADIKVKM